MLVFEVTFPGSWLESEDLASAGRIRSQLFHLLSTFFEANLALNLFQEIRYKRPSFVGREQSERDGRLRAAAQEALLRERGFPTSPEGWVALSHDSELRFKREQWSLGRLPREFEFELPLAYARMFIFALDGFERAFGVLAQDTTAPPDVARLHAQMVERFPTLRGVRNTLQHMEDRSRGLGAGREPKPLDLKPLSTDDISSPAGGTLVLNGLSGTAFCSTMADGTLGSVDVSVDTLTEICAILQAALNSFRWRGPPLHFPSL